MRRTIQRQIIIEELRKNKTHPTAKELFAEVKKRIPTISFGTVYRTLRMLKEKGEVLELTFPQRSSRWDGFTHPHQHFFCEACNRVFDIEKDISEVMTEVEKIVPGKLTRVHLEIYGICRECMEKGGVHSYEEKRGKSG